VPQQIRKSQDEARAARKEREQLLQELADAHAAGILAGTTESNGRKVIVRVFEDRDMNYVKLLAQRLTREQANVVALLASTSDTPALVFAASPGQGLDMNGLLKDALAELGGRGGGSKEMAQGGTEKRDEIPNLLKQLASKIS